MRKMLATGTLVLLVAVGDAALAGVNVWTPLGPDGGQFVTMAVDATSPSTLWAAGIAGAFKSSDRGANWVQLFSDRLGARGIATHPTTPGTVVLVDVWQQIWRTTDGGSSWSLTTSGLPALGTPWPRHLVAFNPVDPSLVYLGRTDGLYRSTDGGASWASIGAATLGNTRQTVLFIDPASPATLWTWGGRKDGIKKSTDGGLTWSPVNANLPADVNGNVPTWFFAADPSAPANMYTGSSVYGTIYKSIDGGGSWTQVSSTSPPLFAPNGDNFAPLVVPGHPNVLYAGGTDPVTHSFHLYKSIDSGASWVNVTGSTWTAPPTPLAAIPGGTAETVYASFAEGLYASTDAGASWQSINKGLRGLDVGGLAPAATTPTRWYLHASEQGIWKSVDGGETFSAINGNLIDPWNGAIAVDPGNPDIVYAAGQTSQGYERPGA